MSLFTKNVTIYRKTIHLKCLSFEVGSRSFTSSAAQHLPADAYHLFNHHTTNVPSSFGFQLFASSSNNCLGRFQQSLCSLQCWWWQQPLQSVQSTCPSSAERDSHSSGFVNPMEENTCSAMGIICWKEKIPPPALCSANRLFLWAKHETVWEKYFF